jgi:hypothetical protein
LNTSASETATHIRVVLIDCAGLLGDIVRQAVAAQPDLDVIADLEFSAAVRPLVDTDTDADLILWNNADESRVMECLRDLSRERNPRVLATLSDGREAALWELTPHKTQLAPLSPGTLVDAIRRSLETVAGGSA